MKTIKSPFIIVTVLLLFTISSNAQNNAKKSVSLREKFYGCISGAHIGSSMGAAVEGWSYTRIEETYGTVEELLPYEHYGNGWKRDPGTTEDGVERQKLMITAIMRKGDRVNAEDVRAVWRTEINPKAPGNVSEPFEGELLAIAKSNIPARDIGKYCDYSGLNSFARACHPIGLWRLHRAEINKSDKRIEQEKDWQNDVINALHAAVFICAFIFVPRIFFCKGFSFGLFFNGFHAHRGHDI